MHPTKTHTLELDDEAVKRRSIRMRGRKTAYNRYEAVKRRKVKKEKEKAQHETGERFVENERGKTDTA